MNRTNRQKTVFVGKAVFAWSFILVAAQIMAVGLQLRGRAAGARILGVVITAPGALMAEQLGVRNTGTATARTWPPNFRVQAPHSRVTARAYCRTGRATRRAPDADR